MTFAIDFEAGKPARAANLNVHDAAAWGFAHEWAETMHPANQLPLQYAVHYIYELINRPWLPDRACTDEMVVWMQSHQA